MFHHSGLNFKADNFLPSINGDETCGQVYNIYGGSTDVCSQTRRKNGSSDALYTAECHPRGGGHEAKRSADQHLVADRWRTEVFTYPKTSGAGVWGKSGKGIILLRDLLSDLRSCCVSSSASYRGTIRL